jgi:Tfp pilus assembly protein PilN
MNLRINLLDWRAQRRERRRRRFLVTLGASAFSAVLLVALTLGLLSMAANRQDQRNRYLQAQIADLDHRIHRIADLQHVRDQLISRMHVIERLQTSRSGSVHFFDAIVDTLPDGVYLQSLQQKGGEVSLKGVAESNARVSSYMKRLDDSPWFQNPRLVVIRTATVNHHRRAEFTLQVKNLADGAAKAKAPAQGAGS